MVKAQGWFALLWAPLGFAVGLFVTARIALPILLGLPRAIQLVSSGRDGRGGISASCRSSGSLDCAVVCDPIPGQILPAVSSTWFESNGALSAGVWFGVVGILLSALSQKSRADFNADFDQSYRQFYVHRDVRRRRPNRHRGLNCSLLEGVSTDHPANRVVLFCAIFPVANYRKSEQGKRHDYENNHA